MAVALALLGLLLGPFLRARIFRHSVPAGVRPRRDCPACGLPLVPDGLSGLRAALPPSGRCPRCADRIGPPAGAVEAMTGAAFALLALSAPGWTILIAYCWIAAFGVTLGAVDVAVRRLPDRLTIAAYCGIVPPLVADARFGALLCGLGVAAGYLLLVLISPRGIGLGDAKLALSLGSALGCLGWTVAVVGAAAGFALGGAYGGYVLLTRRAGRADELPHGPAMLLGALATAVVAGR